MPESGSGGKSGEGAKLPPRAPPKFYYWVQNVLQLNASFPYSIPGLDDPY